MTAVTGGNSSFGFKQVSKREVCVQNAVQSRRCEGKDGGTAPDSRSFYITEHELGREALQSSRIH